MFYSYIKPLIKKSWPNAEKINKITYNMVQNSPYFSDVANKIYYCLNNAELIVGYNHERFDLPFVQYKIWKIISNNTFDVMKNYSKFINKKFQKLKDCCNFFNITNKKEHDSLSDAAVTLACFYKLIEVDQNYNIEIYD